MRIGKLTHTALLALLLGALGSSGLGAQEGDSPYSLALKVRVGLHTGDMQKAHFDNKVMGLGAEAKYKLNAFGLNSAVSAELTWEVVPGRHHDVIDWSDPWPLVLDPVWSYDDRKEKGEGFSLRLAYWAPLPDFGTQCLKGCEWFAGIGIDRYKVYSEFKWTLRDSTNYPPPNLRQQPPLYVGGGGTFHEEGADIGIGIFAGIRYRINDDLGFEVALRNFGMKHWDFTPGAYSGSETGKLSSGSTRGTSIEFAITMKL